LKNRRLEEDQRRIFRLLVIADEAMKSSFSELETLEQELHAIVTSCVNKLADRPSAADQFPVSLAIEHARRSIEGRKAALRALNRLVARNQRGDRNDAAVAQR
jgi:hypothetical protein